MSERPNLSHGPSVLAIPGPSMMPPAVLAEMARPMPDIYEGELIDVSDEVFALLPPLVGTTSAQTFVTIGNGHAVWEMVLVNTLAEGDRVLVASSGLFGEAWGDLAARLGCRVERIAAEPGRAVDPAAVAARLADDREHAIKAVLTTHVETASSARHDIAALRGALDAAGHPALLMVDAVASLGCEELRMDDWGVDVVVAASQKGMMTPPGLGLAWASAKALDAHRRAPVRSWYWSWSVRSDPSAHYLRYGGTPPVSHLFAMRAALRMIHAEGVANVWARHAALAGAVRAAVAAWSQPDGLSLNCPVPAEQANCVTTIRTGRIDAEQLRRVCRDEFGVTLGVGLREFAGSAFRIGHMGYVSASSVLGVLGVVEAALARTGAGFGASGVAAAAAALA